MTKQPHSRRYRRRPQRRIWVDSGLKPDLEPTRVAQIITRAALAQAQLESQARAVHQAQLDAGSRNRPGADGSKAEASDV